jgi:hypothetical protein
LEVYPNGNNASHGQSKTLTKANRLFTGTHTGRIIEILQNARRAGATKVEITNQNGVVSVRDNGSGM